MMEVICNDRLGGKVRVKCFPSDTILILKKLIAAHTGTRFDKIRLQKAHTVFKDHITIDDYEISILKYTRISNINISEPR